MKKIMNIEALIRTCHLHKNVPNFFTNNACAQDRTKEITMARWIIHKVTNDAEKENTLCHM